MPLPPYIKRSPGKEDFERYQTVYANSPGAIAAPTAGLHFTEEILRELARRGVEILSLTLHVGLGTFSPVTAEEIDDHVMEEEGFELPPETAEAVNRARSEGRRVIAVGTTVTRTLETAFSGGRVRPGPGASSLFIRPGHNFRAVTGLLTNFHLPRATPIMLVSAFAGLRNTALAYQAAVRENYRFFSYGDAMLVL